MSKKVDLPPVLTIMSVLVVGKLLGRLGLLVAVPTLAVIMVVVRRILLTRDLRGAGIPPHDARRPLVLRLPAPEGGVIVPKSHIDVVSLLERRTTAVPV